MTDARKEYLRRYKANWYQRHKSAILAARRGDAKTQAYNRAYYARTKERRKELRKTHNNTIRPREYFRAWRKNNREKYLASNRARYARNPKKFCKESAMRHRKQRDELRDCYVRKVLSFRTGIQPTEWPADLVDIKRAQMKVKRLCQKSPTTKC